MAIPYPKKPKNPIDIAMENLQKQKAQEQAPQTPAPQTAAPVDLSKPISSVEFKDQGRKGVKYTTGGKTFDLSPSEYNAFRVSQGATNAPGQITPQVQELIALEKNTALRNQTLRDVAAGQNAQDVTRAALASTIPQPVAQALPQDAAAQTAQAQDQRGFLAQTFAPTAQEGADRRQASFGTTSKIPPILLGAGIAATGGAGLIAQGIGGAGVAASTAAASAGTAGTAGTVALTAGEVGTTAITGAKLLSGKVLGKSLLYIGGAAQIFSAADLKDSRGAVSETMQGANDVFKAVASGEMQASDAESTFDLAESSINDLERAIKLAKRVNPKIIFTGANKETAQLIDARRRLARLRALLPQATQDAAINKQAQLATLGRQQR